MKRLTFLVAFLLILGMAAFGADVEKLSVSGTVGMSFGDDDTSDDISPSFSSTKSGAFAKISVGTSNDKVEAGISVNLVPAIAWNDPAADPGKPDLASAGAGDQTGWALIADMITWYEKIMAGKVYTVADDDFAYTVEDIDFNALEDKVEMTTGLDFVIEGSGSSWTVGDDDDDDEIDNDAERNHIDLVYVAVRDAILGEIENVSSVYSAATSGSYISVGWTDSEVAAAEEEDALYSAFEEYVWGSAPDEAWTASTPVSGAYLRLNKMFGVVDLEFEVNGKAVSVGSMVTSTNSKGGANLGVTVGLADGVVPGLTVDLLFTHAKNSITSDDAATYGDETDSSDAVAGAQLNAGYVLSNDTLKVGAIAKFGIKDFAAVGENLLIGIEPVFGLPGVMNLSLTGEFNMLLLGTGTTGIGVGAGLSATVVGITPSVKFYMKDANYGGDDSYDDYGGYADIADSVDDGSMMAQFNSTDDASATALAIDVSADLASLLGMKLITLGVGADFFFPDSTVYDYSANFGMDGNIGLDFSELLGAPLTVGFSMGQYAENDMTWKGTLGYTYAELFKATASLEQVEADVLAWSLGGSVSF